VKSQVVVDKGTGRIICTAFANGRRHDFRLFKESRTRFMEGIEVKADTGYQGIHKFHKNSVLPRKRTKKRPLTKEDKAFNHIVSSGRVLNEHIIGHIKRFKIVADRYRNRRKRFGLRFTLISAICNYEI
jgi:hypothetical protein